MTGRRGRSGQGSKGSGSNGSAPSITKPLPAKPNIVHRLFSEGWDKACAWYHAHGAILTENEQKSFVKALLLLDSTAWNQSISSHHLGRKFRDFPCLPLLAVVKATWEPKAVRRTTGFKKVQLKHPGKDVYQNIILSRNEALTIRYLNKDPEPETQNTRDGEEEPSKIKRDPSEHDSEVDEESVDDPDATVTVAVMCEYVETMMDEQNAGHEVAYGAKIRNLEYENFILRKAIRYHLAKTKEIVDEPDVDVFVNEKIRRFGDLYPDPESPES